MTEEQKENLLAESLEEYHAQRARGEIPDMAAFEARLGDLFGEFHELILAETLIDEAMTAPEESYPGQHEALPVAWGAYTLLSELGRGASGVVYEAIHRKLGRTVALKVLRASIDTDDTARQRFTREAQALAQVRHDHIVQIYEFGEVGGQPYYAMELIAGETLAARVRKKDLPAPREVCEGMAGVTDALHTLHEAGIVHRDVKPSNVMIRPDGRYVLADFGLARTALSQTMTKTGDALGTPLYMSPEQMLGKRDAVDRRTDVYGTGATLYEMLTGRPPFKTDNLHALMRMVLSQRPEPPRAVAPDLPQEVSRIAAKCLEKEPRDRYDTADELSRDLRAFAVGERVFGRPLTRPQRAVRWVHQHRALSAAALVLVALGTWFLLKPPAPARLTLDVFPYMEADVQVDDGEFAAMPLHERVLTAGQDHVVRVRARRRGFKDRVKTYRPEANQPITDVAVMVAANPDQPHPDVVAAYAEVAQVAYVNGIRAPETNRSGGGSQVLEVSMPRGTVRRSDLGQWQLYVTETFLDDYPDGGFVEFEVEGEIRGRVPFPEPSDMKTVGTFPEAVLASLKPGDVLKWGFRAKDAKSFAQSVTVQINDIDLTAKMQVIDGKVQRIANPKTRELIRVPLRASLLLNHDLAYAAYREIDAALKAGSESLYILHLQRKALESMFPARTEREEATPWNDMLQRWDIHWDAQSEEDRAQFLEAAASR